MAPNKKKQGQTMSLGDFINDSSFGGSWADEVEDTIGTQPLPAPDRPGMGSGMFGGDRSFLRSSAPTPLPTRPPFTAHIGNLPYDATQEAVEEFFDACGVLSVRIIEDRELQRPKGFAYVEFHELDGLKRALDLDNTPLNGRYIKVKVADPPRGGADSMRDLSDWTRKGPLADLPGRGGGDRRGPPREPVDDGRVRDFGNWERRGPLSPVAPEAPPMSREGSRARTNDARVGSMRDRRQSPAWGEGRSDGSRPPQREFRDKPERVVTAADRDTAWRSNMRPDPRNITPSQSRDGSEAPSSPAASAAGPAGRPKLNLAKRTVSDATDTPAPAPTSDSKPNPFGAARPIDTRARERAIEERKQKEKQEAEEKAKEERRLAKEAAAKAEAEAEAAAEAKAAAEAAAKEEATKAAAAAEADAAAGSAAEAAKPEELAEKAADNGQPKEQKLPTRTREPRDPKEPKDPKDRPDIKSRASESGNWRQASGEHKAPRGAPRGPRGGGRGGRGDGPRPQRANGSQQQQSPTPVTAEAPAPAQDEDGWSTVRKGGRRQGRPVAS